MEILVERWRRLPSHFKILVFLLAVGGSVAYGWTVNIEPALETLTAAKAENEALDSEVESLNNAGKGIVAVQSELRRADEEIAAMLTLLPGDPEVDRVLSHFAAVSKETGVEVKEFEPVRPPEGQVGSGAAAGQPAPTPVPTPAAVPATAAANATQPTVPPLDESVSKTAIKVKLVGTFSQIATFFDRILSLPRVIKLTSFELKNNGKAATTQPVSADVMESNPGSPKLTVSATFEAYYQKGLIEQFRVEEQAVPKAKPLDASAALHADPASPAVPGAPDPSNHSNAHGLSAKALEGTPAP